MTHVKIGIISDTHGLVDPRVPELLAGVDHILHAGDVGSMGVIHELEAIAPVTAVTGNVDDCIPLKYRAVARLAGHTFLIRHIVDPWHPSTELREDIQATGADVVIFGHTHKPFSERISGVFFFNPGYAGKQRFQLPRSLAILECEGNELRPRYLPLGGERRIPGV